MHRRVEADFHARPVALGKQHARDVAGMVTTVEPTVRPLLIFDAVAFHQGDEVLAAVTTEGRAWKVRIAAIVVFRRNRDIGEVALAATGDTDLGGRFGRMVQHHHAPPPVAGGGGAHQPRRTGADDGHITPVHRRCHGAVLRP